MKIAIRKHIYNSSNFDIYSFVPCDTNNDIILDSKWGTATIKGGNISFMAEGQTYDVIMDKGEDKYGTYYTLVDCPTMSSLDFHSLTYNDSYNMLCTATTARLAKSMLDAYPDIVTKIMDDNCGDIDFNRIYGVKGKLFNKISRNVQHKFKYFEIFKTFPEYNFTTNECVKLSNVFGSIENIEKIITENPYEVLINVLDRNFLVSDLAIKNNRPDLYDSDIRTTYAIVFILKQNEMKGSTVMSAQTMAEEVYKIAPNIINRVKDLCNSTELFYFDEENLEIALRSTYEREKEISEQLLAIQKTSDTLKWDINTDKYKMINNQELTKDQFQVLEDLCNNNIVILTGNAGCGKSFTVKAILNMLKDNNKTFTLLTPTGTSAKVLSNYTQEQAFTIHKKILNDNYISTDVLIVDEFSFVGIELMWTLLDAIEANVKIVFVGDEQQLSSIDKGNVFKDMIYSKKFPCVHLDQVFRYGKGDIDTIATDTRHGKPYMDYNGRYIFEKENSDNSFKYLTLNENPVEQCLNEYDKLLEKYDREDILILSPFNVGDCGTYAINSAIQEKYNPLHKGDRQVEYKRSKHKIRIRKNDYVLNTHNWYHALTYSQYCGDKLTSDISIMNGECGIVKDIDEDNNIIVQFDEGMVVYTFDTLCYLLLANAFTVHKAQGHQAKAVIFIFTQEHERFLHRALIYVANSRAQEKLIEIGDISVLNNALNIIESDNRNTLLCKLLKEGY